MKKIKQPQQAAQTHDAEYCTTHTELCLKGKKLDGYCKGRLDGYCKGDHSKDKRY